MKKTEYVTAALIAVLTFAFSACPNMNPNIDDGKQQNVTFDLCDEDAESFEGGTPIIVGNTIVHNNPLLEVSGNGNHMSWFAQPDWLNKDVAGAGGSGGFKQTHSSTQASIIFLPISFLPTAVCLPFFKID